MGIGFIIYMILVIALGCTAILYVQFSALQVFLMACIIPFAMLFIVWHLRRNVLVDISVKSPVAEKESLRKPAKPTLLVTVENTSTFMPLMKGTVHLSYENKFSGEKGKRRIHFSVDCSEKQVKEMPLTIWHSGDVIVKVKCVKVHDYFSIFAATIKKDVEKQSILVLPPQKEFFLEEEALLMESEGDADHFSPYKKGEDASEIFDIREFKEGDKLQRIHWKLSMKRQTLMVKEFSLPLTKATYMFIDTYNGEEGKKRLRQMDQLIQGAVSISMKLLAQEYPQQLVWYDGEAEEVREFNVSKEEELFWAFQQMFKAAPNKEANELIGAYSAWEGGKPHEAGLYLCVADEDGVDTKELHVRHLEVIDLRTEKGDDANETEK